MHHSMLYLILVVAVPMVLYFGHRIGDLLPMLAFLGVAAFMIFVLPPIHQSLLYVVVPLCVAGAIKMLRGDKRGSTGSWRRR